MFTIACCLIVARWQQGRNGCVTSPAFWGLSADSCRLEIQLHRRLCRQNHTQLSVVSPVPREMAEIPLRICFHNNVIHGTLLLEKFFSIRMVALLFALKRGSGVQKTQLPEFKPRLSFCISIESFFASKCKVVYYYNIFLHHVFST